MSWRRGIETATRQARVRPFGHLYRKTWNHREMAQRAKDLEDMANEARQLSEVFFTSDERHTVEELRARLQAKRRWDAA